ncbi:MAG TPA: tetratricopeptide repeat protein [Myxococcaceae bacterium]|nr:tetratricopeptide repeat protein [Myxococcaceae bacterium]
MRGATIAICLTLGCAHQPRPPPLTGWRELRSAHFTLRTDLPEDSARSTLEKLETLRWWLQAAWSTGGDSPGRTQAIVLEDPAELSTFTPMGGLAATSRDGPLVVTAGQIEGQFGDRSPRMEILAHEVAHDLIRQRLPGAPRWFHEGLAGYLETVEALDEHRVRFGSFSVVWLGEIPDPGHPLNVLGPRLLSLDETESRRWETATGDSLAELRRSARLWVRMLRLEEPARIRALETALAAGTSWRRAWADLRKGLDVAAMQERMWRVKRTVAWPTEVRPVAALPGSTTRPNGERLLARWEVHLARAQLWAIAARMEGGEDANRHVRTELETAAAAAPDEPLPQIRLAELELDPELRRERAEALVRRFPASAEPRVLLARVLRDGGGPVEGREAIALAAVRAAPDNVDALTAYALEELRAGDATGALRSVARAEELEPWNPTVFVARALVLGATGRCDEAVDAMERALDVLPDTPPPGEVQVLVAKRERISTMCRPSTGP